MYSSTINTPRNVIFDGIDLRKLDDRVEKLETLVETMAGTIQDLCDKIVELEYAPNGLKFMEAKEDFEEKQNEKTE